MLMSVPVIIAAGGLQAVEVYESGDLTVGGDALIAAALSFITALIAIAALMRWIERIRFTPFVIYRLLIGGGLLYWLYS